MHKNTNHSVGPGNCFEPLEQRLLLSAAVSLGLDHTAVNEGDSVILTGTFATPPETTSAVKIDWGDGGGVTYVLVGAGAKSFTLNPRAYVDDQSGTIDQYTIVATLLGSSLDPGQVVLAVNNVIPTAGQPTANPSMLDQSGVATLTGSFSDPGILDTHTVMIDWGDGTTSPAIVAESNGSGTYLATHHYLGSSSSGTYDIQVAVTDKDGGTSLAGTFVTTPNKPPTLGPLTLDSKVINENGTTTVSGTFTDLNMLDEHTAVIDWGDGTTSPAVITESNGSGMFTATHQYLDNLSGQITATVTDSDGAQGVGTASVTVSNLPPVIQTLISSAADVGSAAAGQPVTITGTFADVGTLDAHLAIIDWGDGTISVAVLTEASGSGTFSGSHAYAMGGVYNVSVTLTDDDGGGSAAQTAAVVSGVALHDGVLQIIGTSAADTVKISQNGSKKINVSTSFVTDPVVQTSFDMASVQSIEVMTGAGDDQITIANSVSVRQFIDAGTGDDHIKAGGGATVLIDSQSMTSPSSQKNGNANGHNS